MVQPSNIEPTSVTGAVFISPKLIDSNELHPVSIFFIEVTEDQIKFLKSIDLTNSILESVFFEKNEFKESTVPVKCISKLSVSLRVNSAEISVISSPFFFKL